MLSFSEQLRRAQAEISAPKTDPWPLRGKIDFDGLERVTSQKILDLLEIPQHSRRAPVYRRVAKLMAELGWTAVRVRDLTGRGCKEQVRGYCRQPLHDGWAA
jgi:hypothetical protein